MESSGILTPNQNNLWLEKQRYIMVSSGILTTIENTLRLEKQRYIMIRETRMRYGIFGYCLLNYCVYKQYLDKTEDLRFKS